MQKTYLEIESKILCGLKDLYVNILDIILKSIQVRKIDLKWLDVVSDADMIRMIKGDEMSEFEKELTKVLDKNDTFSIGITFEEINEILMKNPSKNKESYDRLTPIVEQKRKVFMNQLKKRVEKETR